MTISDFVSWVERYSKWLYALVAVLLFLFWKIVINFPAWLVGKMLSIFYRQDGLSKAVKVSCDPGTTCIVVGKPPVNLPSIRDLKFSIWNSLRFFDVEIKRADLDVRVYRNRLVSRERFVGEIVRSVGTLSMTFGIDLDEFRLALITSGFSPQQPPTALDVEAHLTLQCATFFRPFTVNSEHKITASIYSN